MKRGMLVLVVCMFVSGAVFAEGMDLGDFPLGKWLDANWDAVWEFSSGNIRILDLQGNVLYDFADKTIENYSLKPSAQGLVLAFSCKEAGRDYTFTKPLTNMNLTMVIEKPNGTYYKVELPMQR